MMAGRRGYKHFIKVSILLVWLGLMGWWWLESRTWPAPEKINAAFLPDFNDYYGLKYGDQKIGWAFKSLRRLPEGGYQGGQGMVVQVALPGRTMEVRFNSSANLDRLLNLVDFTYVLQVGPLTVSESGLVADGRLSAQVNLGEHGPIFQQILEDYRGLLGGYADRLDFSREAVLNAPAGPALAMLLPPYLSYLGLEPGRQYALTILEPVTRTLTPIEARVEAEDREYDPETGRDIPVYRVRLTGGGGETLQWLDRFGRTIREESLGIRLERVITLDPSVSEQRLAAQGVTPLTPPPALLRLMTGQDWGAVFKKLEEDRPGTPTPDQNQP